MSATHWLALQTLSGVGGATARKLLDRFGDIEAVFTASPRELATVPRITSERARELQQIPLWELERDLNELSHEQIEVLTWDDERFPAALKGLPDPPLVLFLRGALQPRDREAVAVAGTRYPRYPESEPLAREMGRELARRGLTVVSGLARGVDTQAHLGALEAEGGRTLAVLGSGIRVVYPHENLELVERIVKRGALLSELHPDAPPRGSHLMARNRLVTGLSRALIVVEAGEKSGSLDAARRAKRQGRPVYAVPGSPGTDKLLRRGGERLRPWGIDFDELARKIRKHSPDQKRESLPKQQRLF